MDKRPAPTNGWSTNNDQPAMMLFLGLVHQCCWFLFILGGTTLLKKKSPQGQIHLVMRTMNADTILTILYVPWSKLGYFIAYIGGWSLTFINP